MAIGAFFDIDGTLYRNSLMIEHFKKLVKYEVVDPSLWHSHVKHTYKEWRKRVRDYEDYMLELVDIYIEALKGRKHEDLEFISNQVIKLNGDVVYKFTRDQIKWHQEQGHKVFFISGSPNFLVSKMAEKYGVDACLGAEYLLDDEGRFTGAVVPMWDSVSKNNAINSLAKDYNIDLEESYAYGDTNGDFSMLKKVGHPVAINPTQELLDNIKNTPNMAKKSSIIVERKDVIYKLEPSVNTVE